MVMNMVKQKKSPLYVGEEIHGNIPVEEAFQKALEPYFSKMGFSIKVEKNQSEKALLEKQVMYSSFLNCT